MKKTTRERTGLGTTPHQKERGLQLMVLIHNHITSNFTIQAAPENGKALFGWSGCLQVKNMRQTKKCTTCIRIETSWFRYSSAGVLGWAWC